jgi:hypothetical protein
MRSLIYSIQSVGEAGSPVRMPIIALKASEISEPNLTMYNMWLYNILSQSNIFPPALRCLSFVHIVECSVDGKALEMSTVATYNVHPKLLALSITHRSMKELLLVLYPSLKPFWEGGIIFLALAHFVSLL